MPLALLLAGLLALPPGLRFHASFDAGSTDADLAAGARACSLKPAPGRPWPAGIRGQGLLQQRGERCSYPVAGNFDSRHGTFSIWVKPLNWNGASGKFRHFLVASPGADYTMLLYLYPVGDQAVKQYLRVDAEGPDDATFVAQTGVDTMQQGQWTHWATTWNERATRLFVNGRRVSEAFVTRPLPRIDRGVFTICPVEFWQNRWSDPNEQTVSDEVRLFDRALADDEVLDLYALDRPGGLPELKPSLALALEPAPAERTLTVTVRAAHLDESWRAAAGGQVQLQVRDPRGGTVWTGPVTLVAGTATQVVTVPGWLDGEYGATATLADGERRLTGRATRLKPPTPWLPARTDWRADRVLPPWQPLRRQGDTVHTWNGAITLSGPLPEAVTRGGGPVLSGAARLTAQQPATWSRPRVVEDQPERVTVAGDGRVGALGARYQTLVEFDGLVRCDLTLTPPAGGAELSSLTFELPIRAEVATWYRNPTCQDWNGQSLDEPRFRPYGWLGNEQRGLAWFMESDANFASGPGQPVLTLRREGDTVWVRWRWIGRPVRVDRPLTYTIGLAPTPVRPLPDDFWDTRFGSGPYEAGGQWFVYGWGQQIATLNARLLAHDPAAQRKLVDEWRAKGKETLSYTCSQCTADLSPEYQFYGREWHLTYGDSFGGYQRVGDNAPYCLVPVCGRSSFADFLLWCAREHVRNDWGGGIYTDIDGVTPCDNRRHGCGYTDAFGRSGRTWPIYARRAQSRRLYAICHDAGKRYFAHQHSQWYAPVNAFNDGWCPGEQYSIAVVGKPTFYMDDMPERVWRSEFCSAATGTPTFLLPEISRFAGGDPYPKDRAPSESCIVAALVHGVPLWAGSMNKAVFEEVWAAQIAFGLKGAQFAPYWSQRELVSDTPDVRISYWRQPGRRLVVVANYAAKPQQVVLRAAGGAAAPRFRAAWQAADLTVRDGAATLTVAAKNGALLVAEP